MADKWARRRADDNGRQRRCRRRRHQRCCCFDAGLETEDFSEDRSCWCGHGNYCRRRFRFRFYSIRLYFHDYPQWPRKVGYYQCHPRHWWANKPSVV